MRPVDATKLLRCLPATGCQAYTEARVHGAGITRDFSAPAISDFSTACPNPLLEMSHGYSPKKVDEGFLNAFTFY